MIRLSVFLSRPSAQSYVDCLVSPRMTREPYMAIPHESTRVSLMPIKFSCHAVIHSSRMTPRHDMLRVLARDDGW